jgi:hypothetical protein
MKDISQSFIKIEGGYADQHKITADVLKRLPSGIQKVFNLLGSFIENPLCEEISPDIKNRYELLFEIKPSSVGFLTEFSNQTEQLNLVHPSPQKGAVELFEKVLIAINTGKKAELNSLITNPQIQRQVFSTIKDISPKKEDPWKWSFRKDYSNESNLVYVDFNTRSKIDSLTKKKPISGERIIKGSISEIKVKDREISIFYKPSQGLIKIKNIHENFHEIKLFEDDVYVEVTGLFAIENEHPIKLESHNYSIEIVDLSPIHITNDLLAEYKTGLKLKDGKTITLEVQLDEESEQVYTVTDDRFFMHDFGETREELISMVMSDFELSWKTYVNNKENHKLSQDSKLFKQSLIEHFEGVEQ